MESEPTGIVRSSRGMRAERDVEQAIGTALAPETPATAVSVTVAISTRNRGALIAETLRTLLRLQYHALEILVVDQSTDDATRRVVSEIAKCDPRVRYYSSKTVGLPAGRNIAIRLSSSDVIAYSDDDIIATPDWLEAIVEEFNKSGIAAVYGRILPYEYEGRTGWDVGYKASLERVEYSAKTPPWYIGHGGNMAFRRTDLLEVGGFDPLMGAGGPLRSAEDADISYRLLASNKRVVYSPKALAYHKQWKDWIAQKQMERAYGVGAGAFFAKCLRCGDRYGLKLLLTWVWQLGVRRLGAGLLKWRSRKVTYLGYSELVYPWVGVWMSRRYQVDRRHMTYVSPAPEYFSIRDEVM